MGWKGTLRTIAAAQRRAEREALRRQRQLERQRKQIEKMQALEQATYEVQVYENYIEVLTSVHKDCGADWDWEAIQSAAPPKKPVKSEAYERKARDKLKAYRPSIVDKVLKRSETKRSELLAAVEAGKRKDKQLYQASLKEYERNYADWEETRVLAEKILAGDKESYIEAITKIDPFSEISQLESSVEFHAIDSRVTEITLYVNGEDVVPTEVKTFLKSGRLSIRKMPKTKFYELYQDYACGAVLRVARELFALLPVEIAIVTAVGELLNTKTGHLESRPILSVVISRDTLDKLNFAALDPSDAMENFFHRMKFRKTKGFQPIEAIQPSEIEPLVNDAA